MNVMASTLWSQTWLVVSLGMSSVFVFLIIVVIGLRVMSFFANPALHQSKKVKENGK